jgi:hypothetical protein
LNLRLLLRLLLDPGWVLIIVAAAFLASVSSGFAESHDYLFHLAGGAAVAFFAWRSIGLVPNIATRIAPRKRPIFAFVAALTVAALWEAAEFVADGTLGTSLQNEQGEALRDFGFSALGALVLTVVVRALPNPVPAGGKPIN